MHSQSISALLLAICSVASAPEFAAFPLESLKARLHSEARGYVPVVASVEQCTSATTLSQVTSTKFQSTYPNGLFVVCDAYASGNNASATVLRYIFNSSKGRALVSSSIQAKLSSRSDAWHIDAWRKSFVDYAPNFSFSVTVEGCRVARRP